jgi:hypothetical protein
MGRIRRTRHPSSPYALALEGDDQDAGHPSQGAVGTVETRTVLVCPMPGILHEYAITMHARRILGDGFQTTGLKKALRKVIRDELRLSRERLKEAGELETLEELGEINEASIDGELELDCIHVIPDAFAIVSEEHENYGFRNKYVYKIKCVEVDGKSDLARKLDQWIDFGWEVDCSDYFLLELTILSIHGQVIGTYTDNDFALMWIERTCKEVDKRRAA